MPPQITARIVVDESATTLTVSGDLDIDNQRLLADIAVPLVASSKRYVLDLTDVDFIDSTVIGVVARLRLELARQEQVLHVVPSPRVRSSLELAGLKRVLSIQDSVDLARSARNEPRASS